MLDTIAAPIVISAGQSATTPPKDDVLVKVENVGKIFCRDLKRSLMYGLRDGISDLTGLPSRSYEPDGGPILRKGEFWSNKNISFELRRGECLGLIGRNGAGKTTLLKMLNGLIKPDQGRVEMRGRVGALIALGAGFNPLLSGRENISVNATVLGLEKDEINVAEIIDFAEIREFIDAPVQTYSSGMQVRLGFAIATTMKPDVLILDEVLAVGDTAFRRKCYNRIAKLLENSAVILVSHSMQHIAQVCSSVIMMRAGYAGRSANTLEGIRMYEQDNDDQSQTRKSQCIEVCFPPIRFATIRPGSCRVQYAGQLNVEIEIDTDENIAELHLSFSAFNSSGQAVMNWNTSRGASAVALRKGRQLVRFSIEPLLLHPGRYYCNLSAARPGSIDHCINLLGGMELIVDGKFGRFGDIPYLALAEAHEVLPVHNEPVAER